MNDGKQLKYGQIAGGDLGYEHILTAAQAIVAASGKFVKRAGNGTDTVTIAGDGDAEILGHLECEAIATTLGTEKRKVVCDLTGVFRIPVNSGTYTHLMKGKTCDLSISSNIQGAQLDASAEDTVIVVNGDLVNNEWVDVMINPVKIGAVGVTTV
jgi:hypothetical protein